MHSQPQSLHKRNKGKKFTSMDLGAGEGAINIFYEAFTHGALFPATPLPAASTPRDLRGKVPLTSTETGPWDSAHSLQTLQYIRDRPSWSPLLEELTVKIA